MSTEQEDRVADHATTDDLIVGGGGPRRIWETTGVAPDTTNSGKFYVVQRLAGEWKYRNKAEIDRLAGPSPEVAKDQSTWKAAEEWETHKQKIREQVIWEAHKQKISEQVVWDTRPDFLPPVTRVLYCEFDEIGVMQNVNREKSQGGKK